MAITIESLPIEILSYIITLTDDTKYAGVCKRFHAGTNCAKSAFLQRLIHSIGERDFNLYKSTSENYEIRQYLFPFPQNIAIQDLKLDTSSKVFDHVVKIYFNQIKTLSKEKKLPSPIDTASPFSITSLQAIGAFEKTVPFICFIESIDLAKEEVQKANFKKLNISDKASFLRTWLARDEDVKQVTILNFEGANLSSLPPEIGCFIKLTTLKLNGNPLLTLPIELAELPLTLLDLKGTLISIIPEELKKKPGLQIIL